MENVCVRQHPRIRKTVKWGGVVVSVLLVVVWAGSIWFEATWSPDGKQWVMAKEGRLVISKRGLGIPGYPHAACWRHVTPPHLVWDWVWRGNRFDWYLAVPLWAPARLCTLISMNPWGLDIHARRRAHVGLCPNCNYDRAGLASGAVCPECGKASVPL